MLIALILLVGFGLAAFGLLVMRDPMRFVWLAPGAEGYYQRLVLDPVQRHQMRMLGMIVSFFGLVIITAALKGRLRLRVMGGISDGFLVVLSLSFIAAFGFGLAYTIVEVLRGRGKKVLFGWFEMLKRGAELGPIAVDPAITPRMHKEAKVFTIIYFILAALPIVIALLMR